MSVQTKNKSRIGFVIKKIILYVLTVIVSFLFLFPILWFILSSFKPSAELFSYPLHLLPQHWSVTHYASVMSHGFMTYVGNSLFIAVVATLITLFVSSAAGYALAIYRFENKAAVILFTVFIMGTLIPGDVLIVPEFDVILHLGLYNNIWGVILPTVTSTTGIFLFRQYFVSAPVSLIEAARIDGANEIRIFYTIMLPLAKSVLVIMTIFSFMWRWNDYLLPLIVLSDQKRFTIQLAIRNYIGFNTTNWESILAASVISMIPMVIIFMILQKYIMGGIATSGMKN